MFVFAALTVTFLYLGFYLGHHGAADPRKSDNRRDQSGRRVGFVPMKKFVFAALAFATAPIPPRLA
jgi:hypothetical protein